jgi:hypothetical protein
MSALSCILAAALGACGWTGLDEPSADVREAEVSPGNQIATGPSTRPATQPATSPPPVTGGPSINSVQTIIDDMTLENDARLDGIADYLWATGPKPGAVIMGSDPRGCKMQSWWLNMSSVNPAYKDCDLWTTYIQWFIIYEGVGNAAQNVRVETRRPKSYYLSKSTGRWTLLGEHPGTSWFLAGKDIIYRPGPVDLRTSADGSVAVKVPAGSPYTYHGVWPLGKIDISSKISDFAALFTTVEARLVVDDPSRPDDRDRAILLIHSGADYYPDMTATLENSYPPSAGLSRSKKITSGWQAFNFATISAARQDYQGSSASITTESFRANPPPLQ